MKYKEFVETIKNELDETYDLVYIDYRDEFGEDSIAALLAGDWDKYDDLNGEWEGDSRHDGATYVLEDLIQTIAQRESKSDSQRNKWLSRIDSSDEWYEIHEMIRERDTGEWFDRLLAQTSAPLMRVRLSGDGEDLDYSASEDELEARVKSMLDTAGVTMTDENLQSLVNNGGWGWRTGFWLFTPEQLTGDILASEYVDVENPGLWVTNTYAGDGWCEQVTGVVRIKRSDMIPDKKQFGPSADDVFGFVPNVFECEVHPVEAVDKN